MSLKVFYVLLQTFVHGKYTSLSFAAVESGTCSESGSSKAFKRTNMDGHEQVMLEILKVVYDLFFALNAIPLQRSETMTLAIVPAERSSRIFLFLQVVAFFQKAYSFMYMIVVGEMSHVVIHFAMLNNIVTGFV